MLSFSAMIVVSKDDGCGRATSNGRLGLSLKNLVHHFPITVPKPLKLSRGLIYIYVAF
jgi:hypothetical protein